MDHASVLNMMHHTTFDNMSLYEQSKPRFIFKMPRVVPDQKAKFESDELFRRLSRESEVRYTAHRERPQEERIKRFLAACNEGHVEIAFSATGTNLQLIFNPPNSNYMTENQCDFEKEQGKVHLKSSFIMNGVCVRWRGYLDLERLDGVGTIEYDEEFATREDTILREQMERYSNGKSRYRLDRPDHEEGRRNIPGPHTLGINNPGLMQRPYMKMRDWV